MYGSTEVNTISNGNYICSFNYYSVGLIGLKHSASVVLEIAVVCQWLAG